MRHQRLLFLFAVFSVGAHAQWLNFPTPGTPRTRDGKPNLAAPVPRALDGKPDLSGVWRHEITPLAELKRLYGDSLDAAAKVDVPGMEAIANHKYSRNILVDFQPGESPMRAEAVETMRQRQQQPCRSLRRGTIRHPPRRSTRGGDQDRSVAPHERYLLRNR